MKGSTTALLAGLVVYLLYKKTAGGGLSGLSGYPVPGSSPGYYSSPNYSNWYTTVFLPWYLRAYGTYPPQYLAYQQQQADYTNLFTPDGTGGFSIDPDRPTPIQAPRYQYPSPGYFPQQYGFQPQYAYNQPFSPYAVPANQANIPGQINYQFPM